MSFWVLKIVTASAVGRKIEKVECLAKEKEGKSYLDNQMAGPLKIKGAAPFMLAGPFNFKGAAQQKMVFSGFDFRKEQNVIIYIY